MTQMNLRGGFKIGKLEQESKADLRQEIIDEMIKRKQKPARLLPRRFCRKF